MNKITFICPSYNHEKYVLNFLNSLLSQTSPNWELIIIDDSSQDKNADKIKSVKDKRIHFIQNPYNQGINAVLNKGIPLAGGELISLIASDDILEPKYVQTILETFEEDKNISVCYTPLNLINQKGKSLNKIMPLPIQKSQEQIFAEMFLGENLLWSPGMAFKKSAIMPFLPLSTGLLHYQDWQINFFLMYQGKIKLLKSPLVKYRISRRNISSFSAGLKFRKDIETKKLMDTVSCLIGLDKDIFIKYFGQYPLIKRNNIVSKTIPFWLGRLALTSSNLFKQKWGLEMIMNFISIQENMDLLNKLYGFTFKDYVDYTGLLNLDLRKEMKDTMKIIIRKYAGKWI